MTDDECMNKNYFDSLQTGSREHPYLYTPTRVLSNTEITDLFRMMELRIGTENYNSLSATLKTQFKNTFGQTKQ